MIQAREPVRILGWAILGLSTVAFTCLFLYLSSGIDDSDIFESSGPIFRGMILAAALTLWPGYALSVAMVLVHDRTKPPFRFCVGMLVMLVGALVYGLDLRPLDSLLLNEFTAIAALFVGVWLVEPFAKSYLMWR
jgi:hypothetical protein